MEAKLQFIGTFCGVGLGQDNFRQLLVPKIFLSNLKWHVVNRVFVASEFELDYSESFVSLGQLIPGERISFEADMRWKSGKYELCNLMNIRFIYSSGDRRYPLPKNRVALIGYVMEVNKNYYLSHDMFFDQRYVDIYDAWCDSLAYKKDFAARQSNAKSSTTKFSNQNRHYHDYYTISPEKEGGRRNGKANG
ncbi:hypothetical protein [Limosilactobacillus agrestimuris]|uniref:hypothetical protein n=1 Tax=Limosilactobacillus agrestimuris TaxID=2941331 RepID=UPI00203C7541|nr:hypothetical protein [Limosilactobacillus agrestimuris]